MNDVVPLIAYGKAVLKIDVESHEPYVFSGAKRLFDVIEVPHVFMEWGDKSRSKSKTLVQDMLDFLTTRGYMPCRIMPNSSLLSIIFPKSSL
ncbi:MAG: FkbM family methyltransferase, partial [Pseudomonadota bacterium]